MEGKPLREVSADEKGTPYPSCCSLLWEFTAGSNTTTGEIRRIVKVLEEIH